MKAGYNTFKSDKYMYRRHLGVYISVNKYRISGQKSRNERLFDPSDRINEID